MEGKEWQHIYQHMTKGKLHGKTVLHMIYLNGRRAAHTVWKLDLIVFKRSVTCKETPASILAQLV